MEPNRDLGQRSQFMKGENTKHHDVSKRAQGSNAAAQGVFSARMARGCERQGEKTGSRNRPGRLLRG